MMNTLAERLNFAMQEKNMTQSALAKAVGMAQSSIWKLTSGEAKSSTKLIAIANALNVNVEWLHNGSGTMSDKKDLFIETSSHSDIRPTRLKATVWEETPQDDKEFVEIPLLDIELSAGDGCCELTEQSEYSLIFRRYFLQKAGVSVSNAKLVRISGDSMEPRLSDGDIVGINIADTRIRDGKTYAIRQGDLLRVKVLIEKPDGSIIIRSINREEFADDILTRQQREEQLVILGRVFWSSHSW